MKPPANKIHKPKKFSIKTPLKKIKNKEIINFKVPSSNPSKIISQFFSVFVWLPRK